VDRSIGLEKLGLMGMDAVHVACAEKAKTDFFITCDNSLLNKLKRIDTIQVRCYNLLDFLSKEVFKDENIK
jgi:predicted nucleic acid-binding protein